MPAYFQSGYCLLALQGSAAELRRSYILCCFHAATWYVIALYVVGGISSPWGAGASSHVLRADPCYCFFF